MSTHYISLSGSSGCLPEYCEAYEGTEEGFEAAVEGLDNLFELTKDQLKVLRKRRFLYLGGGYGADYCQVTTCECETPSDHFEDGVVPWEEEEEEDA
jgi:hypothetical protein